MCEEVQRNWGSYRVIHEGDGYRVKELSINPGQSLSNQWHEHRDEVWTIASGQVTIIVDPVDFPDMKVVELNSQNCYRIEKRTWHKAFNPSLDEVAKVVEVWYGDYLDESDITREEMH